MIIQLLQGCNTKADGALREEIYQSSKKIFFFEQNAVQFDETLKEFGQFSSIGKEFKTKDLLENVPTEKFSQFVRF